jgi:uncharacterized membrane protein YphA (DoxX/SURF4 family)
MLFFIKGLTGAEEGKVSALLAKYEGTSTIVTTVTIASSALSYIFIILGILLMFGLFTYAAALASAKVFLVIHFFALIVSVSKVHMWSLLVFTSLTCLLLWLAQWDRLSIGSLVSARWFGSVQWCSRAQRGPQNQELTVSVIVLLLRLALGLDFIMAGVSKFHYPWIDQTVQQFKETILSETLIYMFSVLLPYVQIVNGATIMVGACTRVSTILLGLQMLVLLFGQLLIDTYLMSLWSMFLYVSVILAVLWLSSNNQFSLDSLLLCKSGKLFCK